MHTSQVSYFTLDTQITSLSFHPSQWPAHLLVQHSQLERTSKHANYVNRSIIFQSKFEHVYPLTARAEPFDFYVHIYIAGIRVVKKKNMRQHIASLVQRRGREKRPQRCKAFSNRDAK